MNDLASQLMELKRRAALSGRPVSREEMAGAASGYFSDQAKRNLMGKEIALQEQALNQNALQFADQLMQRKAEFAGQLDAARKARQMGWINTGAGAGLGGYALYAIR